MSEIHGKGNKGPIEPNETEMYKMEYKQGTELFEQALKGHASSENTFQKQAFKEVMDKAMRVLNEAAKELKNKDAMDLYEQNQQISKDYETYIYDDANPSTQHRVPADIAKLTNDLENAKDAID